MDDRIKIAIGLALFLTVATMPFWMGFGKAIPVPSPTAATAQGKPVQGEGEREQCVESAAWMRANHMQLLNDWRNSVVREGKRTYVNSVGKQFEKSLTKTCLNCHSDQATLAQQGDGAAAKAIQVSATATLASGNHGAPQPAFCEQCHQSVGVKPYCFSCHIVPVE